METFDSHDPMVLEFTLYFLCPGSEDEGWDQQMVAETVSRFNSSQRAVVCDFLHFVADHHEKESWHKRAGFGLKRWCEK